MHAKAAFIEPNGVAAGQIMPHARVHVVPSRRNGDVVNLRGGIRWMVSNKAADRAK